MTTVLMFIAAWIAVSILTAVAWSQLVSPKTALEQRLEDDEQARALGRDYEEHA